MMSGTKYFQKERRHFSLVITVLFSLLITGCNQGGRIIGGSFGDRHLFLNTELERKLIGEISTHNACFNFPPENILDETSIEIFKTARVGIFHDLFPQGTILSTVLNTLKASGAECRTENKGVVNLTHCALRKEYIDGIKELYIYGWRIRSVYLTQSSFEYLLTTQENRILDVNVNILGCENYELDKELYEESKTIKPIRRLK